MKVIRCASNRIYHVVNLLSSVVKKQMNGLICSFILSYFDEQIVLLCQALENHLVEPVLEGILLSTSTF